MYTVENGYVFHHYDNEAGQVKLLHGQETYSTETETEVLVWDFDLEQGQYVERERLAKVVDDPTTEEDESTSFWQRVADRLAFWRET